ncbi:hypothetical protein LX36DRAFT_91808 [Colletotrichum falcatum]|nr:hypothetical protein LX36DRAFT_91808 [Colletotrichum falcatum]
MPLCRVAVTAPTRAATRTESREAQAITKPILPFPVDESRSRSKARVLQTRSAGACLLGYALLHQCLSAPMPSDCFKYLPSRLGYFIGQMSRNPNDKIGPKLASPSRLLGALRYRAARRIQHRVCPNLWVHVLPSSDKPHMFESHTAALSTPRISYPWLNTFPTPSD